MRIAVLGTGSVGWALAGRLAEGNEVTVGTRDVQATMGRDAPDAFGNPTVRDVARGHRRRHGRRADRGGRGR